MKTVEQIQKAVIEVMDRNNGSVHYGSGRLLRHRLRSSLQPTEGVRR